MSYCVPKTLLVSCPALSSDDPATNTTEGFFDSTCTISDVGCESRVRANVTAPDRATAPRPSRMETRLFRETRSVLEYLPHYPPTVSRGVRKPQVDDSLTVFQGSKFCEVAFRFQFQIHGTWLDIAGRAETYGQVNQVLSYIQVNVTGSVVKCAEFTITHGECGNRQERYDPHGS